ncbi:wall-associated receptor kinase-like 14 [Lactuca sativa]|uniref:Protein kinase domain-containing protein n=1 Tax=Lactuca sativa TaxID=4236 RepID=A0A9R1XWL3_LACSA|nr:wall-associated receptor kinase-like 14 [Lactuca sativa]KAJ0222422.1 hypothetical protein LSAT_V11C200081660 [Lactuca sativa]
MILHLLLFSVILVIASSSSSAASVGANCNRVCKGSSRDIPVRFPFGFSDGCEVPLTCADTGELRIGNYTVLNLTRDHILINLPAKCDRRFEEIRLLRNQNYALTKRNELLLGNCSVGLNKCAVSMSYYNSSSCRLPNSSLNCYSDDDLGRVEFMANEFMDLTKLDMAGCRVLYSAITVVLDGNSTQRSSLSMGFQSAELGWWVHGDCHCHHQAVCENISIYNAMAGYRCHCNKGYDGDGFVNGDGCRRVSNCNASKYMSGECGGTTRVVVLIGGIVVGASLMSIIALICYCIRKRAITRNQMSTKRLLSEATGSFNVPFYPYKEIQKATNGFSEKQWLGIGAYGTVYAGKLNNNEWVAIKKIRHIENYGIDQVMNEIKLLSSVSHPNLVRLLGFCIEKGEQILVYEFMPNGTLCQHLQKERGNGLPWRRRLTIVTETAHAIAYLHSSMNPPIYHRDIKSSNILLDYKFSSKVADFGLSRVGIMDESHISTAPQGTPGYVDPQYHQNYHLSDKSDVYSFGVVLVEIITALKVVDLSRRSTEVNLAALAVNKIGQGRVDEIIDPFLDPNRDAWTLSSIHKVAELAFRCLAFHGDMRPSMTEVADELEMIRMSGDDDVSMTPLSVTSSSSVAGVGSRKVVVPQMILNRLTKSKEKDTSPVSVRDPWLSEQSSPSTNSLLGNIVQ